MIRWWDDADLAATVLSGVDDRDVAQGVGTAILGYHALAKAALAPLASQTLVDPQGLWEVLEGLDLEPVSKALAAATEPVMGPGAARYGQLAAEDLHERAREGLEHLMAQMGAAGLPMPFVVERAIEVVGVPARELGEYAKVVRSPVVAPLVRQDAADRTLMAYAARRGALEVVDGVPGEVSKAPKVRYREEEHPRDADGQFAHKQVGPDVERKERMERRERRDRRTLRGLKAVGAEAKAKADAIASARTTDELVAVLRPRAGLAEPSSRLGEPSRELRAPTPKPPKPAAAALPHDQADATPWGAPKAPPKAAVVPIQSVTPVLIPPGAEQVMIVPAALAMQFMRKGSFTAQELADARGKGEKRVMLHGESTQAAWREARDAGHTLGDVVALRFRAFMPLVEGSTPGGPDGAELALAAKYLVPKETSGRMTLPSGKEMDVIDVTWGNMEDFDPHMQQADWHGGKAVERWKVRGRTQLVMVERDDEGQFAEQGHGEVQVDPDAARRARMERRSRRNRRAGRALAAVPDAPAAPARELEAPARALADPSARLAEPRGALGRRSRVSGAVADQTLTAQQKNVAYANLARMQAMPMTAGTFARLFGSDEDEGLGDVGELAYRGDPVRVRANTTGMSTQARLNVMRSYIATDALVAMSHQAPDFYVVNDEWVDSEEEAIEVAYAEQQRAAERGLSYSITTRYNDETKKWAPMVVEVMPPERPDVLLNGNRAAMGALRSGLEVELVPVGADSIESYAAEYGLSLEDIRAEGDAPLVVFEVRRLHHGKN